jgi:hypothetical protein
MLYFATKPSRRNTNRKTSNRQRRRRSTGSHDAALKLRVEGLEERTLLTTMSVLNTDDSGPGSLRQAIVDANAQAGADVIQFAKGLSGT